MSRLLFWVSVLLVLPAVSSADPSGVPVRADDAVASPRADAAAEPVLDLSLEPVLPESLQTPSATPFADSLARKQAPPAPFSLSLDVNTRREVGDEAKDGSSGPLDLTDGVTGLVERSTFGVTGTYRF